MPKLVDNEYFEKEKDKFDYQESNNYQVTKTNIEEAKMIIIGTMTPKIKDVSGHLKSLPYFYFGKHNKIYGYIDEACKNIKKLKDLKLLCYKGNELKDEKVIKQNIEDIKKILNPLKIVFIDIMGEVLRKKENCASPYDKHIEYYTLADNMITLKEMVKKNNKVKIIINNRLSEDVFKTVIGTNVYYVYLPQRGRGSGKENWIKNIKEGLGK